jgi:inward rectifier potassium channel
MMILRSESPALALRWTLFHVIDQDSPLHGLNVEDLEAIDAGLGLIVSGYDVAAQTVHARKSYEYFDIRFGHRYAEILRAADDGRLKIDYSRFPETIEE